MRSVNKVILIGNLTRDPELRQTQSGQPVTTFSIATNRVWVTKDGGQHSSTEYHDCVAWSRLAEICHQYLKKSKLVYIEGYLKTRSWDTPEGVRKFKTEVVVQDMIMLEKRPKGEEGPDLIPQEGGFMIDESIMDEQPQQSTKEESSSQSSAVNSVVSEKTETEKKAADPNEELF